MDLGLSITVASGVFGFVGLAGLVARYVFPMPGQKEQNGKGTNGYASRKDIRALEERLQTMHTEWMQKLDSVGERIHQRIDAQEQTCSERRERIVRLEEKLGAIDRKKNHCAPDQEKKNEREKYNSIKRREET